MDEVQASKQGFMGRFCLKPNKSSEDKSGRCRFNGKKKKKPERGGDTKPGMMAHTFQPSTGKAGFLGSSPV